MNLGNHSTINLPSQEHLFQQIWLTEVINRGEKESKKHPLKTPKTPKLFWLKEDETISIYPMKGVQKSSPQNIKGTKIILDNGNSTREI